MDIRRKWLAGVAPVALALGIAACDARAQTVSIFHNNDAESQLVNASGQPDFGGAARFAGALAALRANATSSGFDTLTVTSGDNFIPGPEFNASLATGPLGARTYFDADLISAIQYDALAIGNHDFDAGPDVLADFINNVTGPTFNGAPSIPYVSANLDFTGEQNLQDLVDSGRIVKSTVATGPSGESYGIVGATTPNLPFISAPRDVIVDQNVRAAVQAEIDALKAASVDRIVLISHLQGITEDQALIGQLRDLDVAIAGGGDEVLANAGDPLVPGDAIQGPYPRIVTDADGREIPVVTTAGELKYVGNLVVNFDANGELVDGTGALRNDAIVSDSGPVRVVDPTSGATVPEDFTGYTPDADVQANVVDPVAAFVDGLANNIIATSDVDLEGRREFIRATETNEGNLIADAFLAKAQELAPDFGITNVDVAVQNGGGIRNFSNIPVGTLSELDTFDILPFGNILTVVENVSIEDFKDVLENAVSRILSGTEADITGQSGTGRWAQVAGFSFEFDSRLQPLVLDVDGNIIVEGERILNVMLDDGTVLIEDGQVVSDRLLNIATLNFLANGGDQYFSTFDAEFTALGISDQQALFDFIVANLQGEITAEMYPEGGEGRITNVVPVPAAIALFGLGLAAFGVIRRRAA